MGAILGVEPGIYAGGHFRKSFRELSNASKGLKPSKRLDSFLEQGGSDVSITPGEVAKSGALPRIKAFDERSFLQKISPSNLFKVYFDKSITINTYMEAHRRYAAYNFYLDKLEAGKITYGASKREIVDALATNEQKAFKLANDLLVAYDDITALGQDLRETLAPFWSFQEGNMKRFYQSTKNAVIDGKTARGITRRILGPTIGASASTSYRFASLYLRLSALWVATQVWNLTQYPEEERGLSKLSRARPHIIFGRGKDGKVIWMSTPDTFGEALKWVGLDAFPEYVSAYLEGRMDLREIGIDMAKAPPTQVIGALSPVFKQPAEMLGGKSLYPDPFNPRTIQDQWEHFFRGWALNNEYKEIIGRPTRGYGESLIDIFIKRTDMNSGAYWDTLELKRKYFREIGKPEISIKRSPKGWAMYNYRLAKKFGDAEKEEKFRKEYFKLAIEELLKKGVSQKGAAKRIAQSFQNSWIALEPLSGLNETQRTRFIFKLSESEKEKLQRAYVFWKEMLTSSKKKEE